MIDPTLLKAFITMIAAVGGLSLLLFILKRKAASKVSSTKNTSLTVETRIALTPKSHAVVLHYGSKKFLLGVTEHSVQLLSELLENQQKNVSNEPAEKPLRLPNEIVNDDLSFSAFIKSISRKEI